MWIVSVYSEGDLINDEYLRINEHVEKDENGHYFETYDCKFDYPGAVDARIEELKGCIKRMESEIKHLEQYGSRLIYLGSYADLYNIE